jgi:hypothetical protein
MRGMKMPAFETAFSKDANYDEAKVHRLSLPDPLIDAAGNAVATASSWRHRRREITDLFQKRVFGVSPEVPPSVSIAEISEANDALHGRAIRRELAIRFHDDAPALHLLLYLPKTPSQRRPVFFGPNFLGNHTVHSDPGIKLPDIAFAAGMDVVLPEGRTTDDSRGFHADRWPIERVVARGYGVATFFYGDVFPDRVDGRALSVQPLFDGGANFQYDWGALATWAWGIRRALDALEKMPEIDARRVALIGHSRHGKAALWAGALDERFALVIANNSGKGGASLMRRNFGETIRHLVTRYPHWFAQQYASYADREDALPIDQHMLVSLIAPRPVYIASAVDDLWADPKGEFLAAAAASPVYRLLKTDGLAAEAMPEPERPVMSTIGYHLRHGGHGVTLYDWERFLDFADRHMA